jgi:Kef-type K+ transport system membrane component KefB
MTKPNDAFCLFCVVIGDFAPWILLAVSAAMSQLSEGGSETGAWLSAFALLLLTGSYLLKRLAVPNHKMRKNG